MSDRPRRGLVLGALAAVVVAGALADRSAGPQPAAYSGATLGPSAAAPPSALSTSWFCAGATEGKGGLLPGELVITNIGTSSVGGTVELVSNTGRDHTSSVSVAASSSVAVKESVAGGGSWVGAIVELDGGRVAVDQRTDGSLGRTVSPCASSGSPQWYFPAGETYVNADETISLLNPFPAPTVADLSFVTNQGVEQPSEFQAVAVPAGGLVTLDIGSHLRRRSAIAVTVTARMGSLVAAESETVTKPPAGHALVGSAAAASALADPALPTAGASVLLGAPATATTMSWPDGLVVGGVDERYVVYNPGPNTAQLRLSIGLDQGSAEPLPVVVGPYQVATVVSAQQPRIPVGVAHTATLVSVNGVPVVAARVVTASGARSGTGQILGIGQAASAWMVPDTGIDRTHTGQVVIENPGTTRVQVTAPGGDRTLGPFGRLALAVTPETATPLVVRASAPVLVEYDLYATRGAGVSLSPAVPLG